MDTYCFVIKDAVKSPKVHKVKTGSVTWSDGETRPHDLPACGTRVDVAALETERASTPPTWAGDLCRKCFPVETDPDVGWDTFAKAATIRCPKCRQGPRLNCTYPSGASMQDRFHKARMDKAREETP